MCLFLVGLDFGLDYLIYQVLFGVLNMWSKDFFGFGFVLKGSFLSLALSLILEICLSLFRSNSSFSSSFSSLVIMS